MNGAACVLKLPAVLTHAEASSFTLKLAQEVSNQAAEVVVDASALRQFDSSALAVLLECRRKALAVDKAFSVWAAPARLIQLAGVYGVKELIPAASAAPAQ